MFSETVQRILANPAHLGPLEGFTHTGMAGVKGEGAYMQVWLECAQGGSEEGSKRVSGEIAADVIVRAAFKTFGCPSATAAGSMLCTLLTGRELEKAKLITAADLLLVLGGLPEGKEFCAELAVNAMREAIGSSSRSSLPNRSARERTRQ